MTRRGLAWAGIVVLALLCVWLAFAVNWPPLGAASGFMLGAGCGWFLRRRCSG